MKITVTGGEGYIGSRLISDLLPTEVSEIQVIDQKSGMDIRDRGVREQIKRFDPDVIYNLAAISGEVACKQRVDETWEINVAAAVELREAVPEALFVHASTASVNYLGGFQEHHYAHSKYVAEGKLVEMALPGALVICRFGTVVGRGGGKTRWDTPANKFVRDAVREGAITVDAQLAVRPWAPMGWLVQRLRELAVFAQCMGRPCVEQYVPLAQTHTSLRRVAEEVAQLTGAKIIEKEYPGTRSYWLPGASMRLQITGEFRDELVGLVEEVRSDCSI